MHSSQIKEKTVENLFKEWYLQQDRVSNYKLVGQQVKIDIGVIDLLFWSESGGTPIVVEVKRGKAPASVCAQLLGYMHYIERQTRWYEPYSSLYPEDMNVGIPYGIIVAEKLDELTERAVRASNHLSFISYEIEGNTIYFEDHQEDYWREPPEPRGAMKWLTKAIKTRFSDALIATRWQHIDIEGGKTCSQFREISKDDVIEWKR